MGTGPRGNYIHIGRGGLYYRQTLSPSGSQEIERTRPHPEHPVAPLDESCGPMEEITSGSVSLMVDSNSTALLAELDRKRKRLRALPITFVASLLLFGAAASQGTGPIVLSVLAVPLVIASVASHYWDLLKKSVVMMYDLDDETISTYRDLHDAIGALGRAGAIWHISARGDVRDPKYHAGAGQVVRRRRIDVGEHDPPFVRTNVSIHRIPTGSGTLYFCPDTILYYTNHGVGAISYDDLRFEWCATRFIEDGSVPSDARIVDRTWRYVNKKGGPDRRFRDNRELPVCEYEELYLRSSSGLNELLQVSRTGFSSEIDRAAKRMAASVESAKRASLNHQPGLLLTAKSASEGLTPLPTLPSKSPTPLPRSSTGSDGHVTTPTMNEIHEALFRILCCVMVADGRASSAEKARIAELMRKAGASWDAECVAEKIAGFVRDVQTIGFKATFAASLSGVSLFRTIGRPDILSKCVDSIAASNQASSEAERNVVALIRQRLHQDASSM